MKKVDFAETIAACDLKLFELMKICDNQRSRSFLDVGPRSLNLLFSVTTGPFSANFECKHVGTRK